MHDSEKSQNQVYGKIIKGGFFLHQYVGEGIATTMKNNPIVVYGNNVYVLSWNDICNMAVDAGLFEEA